MEYFKQTIKENLSSDPLSLLREVSTGLDAFLEYFTILKFENILEFLKEFPNYTFLPIRGASGTGKNSFLQIIKNCLATNLNLFEYNCSDVTELDDIFFTFYKFMLKHPQQKEIFRNPKSNFKPQSIDEQILHYLKRTNGSTVLIFQNFDKLIDETGNFRATNVKSFFEFLSTIKDIKIILTTGINIRGSIDFPAEIIHETRLTGLEEDKIKDFMSIFKVDVPQSLHTEIYDKTNGYIFSLKFLATAQKALTLPISILLKEQAVANISLNEFLARKLISKLSGNEKKLLIYLALFRHEVNLNILKSIDHFEDALRSLEQLKSYLLVEGENDFYTRDFLKEMIRETISDREKQKLHERIANFYADQIPLKPNERVIELSRTTLYSEKFYHYNISSKLSKNFELQNSRKQDTQTLDDSKLNSDKIKYIASTKYLPDLNIKYDEDIKPELGFDKSEEKSELSTDSLYLTDEEKQLLSEDTENYDEYEDYQTPNDYDNTFDENQYELDVEVSEEETELQKGENLLQKGLELFKDGHSLECISYLKNAMAMLQDKNNDAFYQAKILLAKAQLENFKNYEAKEHLTEIINSDASEAILTESYLELASIDEYENKPQDALSKLSKGLELASRIKDKSLSAKILFRIALIYDDLNNPEKALYHYLLAATDATETKDRAVLASAYSNIAAIYHERNEFQKAVEYHKKSLKEDEYAQNYEGQAKTLASLGSIFLKKDKPQLAIKIFIRETQVAKKTEDKYLIASSYLELGDTFLSIQDYKNALKAYFLSKKNIDSTISTDSKNKIERRFEMVVDEIGESAYNFLVKELRKR